MAPAHRSAPLLSGLVAVAAFAGGAAYAQAPAQAPGAGSILQQAQPAAPLRPSETQPRLQVTPGEAGSLPPSAPFLVKTIRVTGAQALDEPVLHGLVSDQEGRSLTLPQLDALAARITAYYQRQGFPLSRAIVPAQSIQDGVVEIRVLEAHYGDVRLNNSSPVDDALLASTLAPLRKGDPIAGRRLDRSLLLLADIPGVAVEAVLKPGAEVGTSDLDIATTRRPLPYATLTLDNAGNRYIGRARVGGTVDFVDPLHHGDVLSLGLLTTGEGMQYGRASYETVLTGEGLRGGLAFSALHYRLGREVRPLDANGTAQVGSAWVRRPLVRSRAFNVYGSVEYDFKRLQDHVDLTGTQTDRRLGNGVASLTGDLRDSLFGGGLTLWSASWTLGHASFEDDAAQGVDALTARTAGRFSKWNLSLSRLQGLGARNVVYVSVAGQGADSNLDPAEKMTVGGPYSVRAYDISAVSADTGYLATAELRHDLGEQLGGRWRATAFFDTAQVRVNRRPWAPAKNSATLSGAGMGLGWEGFRGWRAEASVAARVGHAPALSPRAASVQSWASLSKTF